MNVFRKLCAVTLALIFLNTVSHADHLPPNLQARGNPEKRLARIHLERTKFADVIRMYGKPSKVSKQPGPPEISLTDYYWRKGKGRLHVVMDRSYGMSQISLVEVEGAMGSAGQTGAGLKIGDNLADLKRIYGPRYKVRNIPNLKIHDVMIQWSKQEFSLVAELDHRDKIIRLTLLPPE
jgi:hypothetical protein